MDMRRWTIGLALAVLAVAPAGLGAQEAPSQGPEQTLREMVTAPTAADRDRAAVAEFLARPEVREVAEQRGIDVEALNDRVATLDDEAAAELARQVRDAHEQPAQVGGDTFVISSTFIIIALLVIILVVVA